MYPGIQIAGRNIRNLRYADDTTLVVESEEEREPPDEAKEENEKAGFKFSIKKKKKQTKIMASGSIISWQIEGERVETVTDFAFLGSKITTDGDCSHEIKRPFSLEGKLCQT